MNGKRKKQKGKEESRKTQKFPAAGCFYNCLIYRFLKILLLISRWGSMAVARK
jgi:hypothetical protein